MSILFMNFILFNINQFIEELADILPLSHINKSTYYYKYNIRISKKYGDKLLMHSILQFNILHIFYPNSGIIDNMIKYMTELKSITISSNANYNYETFNDDNIEYVDFSYNYYHYNIIYWRYTNIKHIILQKKTNITDIINMKKLTTINFKNNIVFRSYLQQPFNFKNLIKLILGKNNNIKDIDLSYLPNLTHLICQYNKNITSVGLLYVKKTLTYLDCGKNNNIDDIGIEKLLNLKYLYCGESRRISDYSICKLTNLQLLSCRRSPDITLLSISCLYNLIHLECNSFIETNTYRKCNISKSINKLLMLSELQYIYKCGKILSNKIKKILPNIHIDDNLYFFPREQ